MQNPLGTQGNVAHAFANIVYELWQGESPYLTPYGFRVRPQAMNYVEDNVEPYSTCRSKYAPMPLSSVAPINTTLRNS